MIEETIEGRYLPVQSVLEEQFTAWFGAGNYKIMQPLDDFAKWKVEVPMKLAYNQKVDLQRRFSAYHAEQIQASATA